MILQLCCFVSVHCTLYTAVCTVCYMLLQVSRISPSCCDFVPFGNNAEQSMVCRNEAQLSSGSLCYVVSIAIAGTHSFEEQVFAQTKCDVYSFRCVLPDEVPLHLKSRVTFRSLCIKDQPMSQVSYWLTALKWISKHRPKLNAPSQVASLPIVPTGLCPSPPACVIFLAIRGGGGGETLRWEFFGAGYFAFRIRAKFPTQFSGRCANKPASKFSKTSCPTVA